MDMIDNNNEANIDFANMNLVKFEVHTITLLADSIQKTRCKWAVENYTNSNKINIITLLIMNLEAKNANHIEDFLFIHRCQIAKFDCPDIGNINNINEDIVSL